MKISNLWNSTRRCLPILGMLLLAACASAPKVEPRSAAKTEIAVNVKSARASYAAGNFARAAKFYELALARARALDDSAEIGRNAYNAAACHLRAGDAKTAAALLIEADREFERSELSRVPVLVLRSRSALALGQTTEASAFASNAVSLAKSADERVETALALADAKLKQGDVAEVERMIASARSDASGSSSLRAAIAAAQGRLFAAKSEPAASGKKFEAAAELSREAGNAGEMAGALQSAGAAFAKAGEWGKSADLLYRAARSFYGQHDHLSALHCVEAAMKSAEAAKDGLLRDQIAALFVQIKKSVEPTGEAL